MPDRSNTKIAGLIVGIIGLATLFYPLASTVSYIYEENRYPRWEANAFSIAAIIFSVAFTLGASATTFYTEKKAAYFMALSTATTAIGFYVTMLTLTKAGGIIELSGIFILAFLVSPLLTSTILLAIPSKAETQ